MRTEYVRIRLDQVEQLREIAKNVPGDQGISSLAREALDLWLETRGPLYLAALKEVRGKLGQTK
jgi:hypothetical protein